MRVPEKRAEQKKKGERERELPSSTEGSLHIQPSYDQLNLILRKLPKARRKKKLFKRIRRNNAGAHTVMGKVPVPLIN